MKPVELYRFTQGVDVFTYTSAAQEQTHNSETYEPIPIGRTQIEVKNELSKANIDVRVSLSHAQAMAWLRADSEAAVGLTVFQKTESDTYVIWKGRMASVKPGKAEIVFGFESIFTSMRRPGLRARYQRPCRHVLYRRGCWLNKADFAVPGTVSAINGNVVTVSAAASAEANEFFTGMLEAPDGTLRFIVAHAGALLTLQRPIASLNAEFESSGPVSVTLYPGCDRTPARCNTRFANGDNHGGFRFIPIVNPFGGSSIA